MRIHKVDKDRIYFVMDSGAYGSILREDVTKFCLVNTWMDKEKIDPRSGICLSEPALLIANAEIELFEDIE
ncbi:hypothetical protein DT57C_000079 [Escherichia phage DT57C]|uniref:Uncharacterized protein n=1 Tax=Escherichia phage DT57C TaxID=2681606 RepID=A0A0A7RUG8_9CAUD|nr:hypothetical protein ACQ32_gp104 [Escherichia phage DT57C]AJA41599.1 hypothetical protein DT57C_000079 [Escherichia phage DT57C]